MTYAEALGAETLLHIRLNDGALFTVRQEGIAAIPGEGQECGIDWNESHQLMFGADGSRL